MGWIPDSDVNAIHDNVAGEIAALTEKTTPVDADLLIIEDSADSNAKKKVQVGNLGGGAETLDDLTDVDLSTPPTDGQVLKYDDDTSTWVPAADDTGSGSLPSATTKGDIAVYDGSAWQVLAAGTNDHVLTAASGESVGLKWAAGGSGGGGDPYITEPGLKPPDSPHTDDDEFTDANGTNPTTTGWAWGNQQSATGEIRGGRMRIDYSTATSRGFHGLMKAVPASGDIKIDTRVTNTGRADYHGGGIALLWGTLASPTWIEFVATLQATNTTYWQHMGNWAGSGTASHGLQTLAQGRTTYLRLTYDASTDDVRGWWSMSPVADGDYVPLSTASDEGKGRPAYMGLIAYDVSSTPITGEVATFDFFRVNWTPDYEPA